MADRSCGRPRVLCLDLLPQAIYLNIGRPVANFVVVYGDDDQIVPIADSALLSAKIVKGATLKIYKGASHGMCTTQKDQVNEDLLAFIKG